MVSPTGARASKCNACIALSFMVGIPRGSHRFAVRLFRDANTSERLNSITVPLQCMDCLCLLLRSVPDFSVHSRGFLARIFGTRRTARTLPLYEQVSRRCKAFTLFHRPAFHACTIRT